MPISNVSFFFPWSWFCVYRLVIFIPIFMHVKCKQNMWMSLSLIYMSWIRQPAFSISNVDEKFKIQKLREISRSILMTPEPTNYMYRIYWWNSFWICHKCLEYQILLHMIFFFALILIAPVCLCVVSATLLSNNNNNKNTVTAWILAVCA